MAFDSFGFCDAHVSSADCECGRRFPAGDVWTGISGVQENKEKIGKKDVPVSGIVENMDEYDTVYLGFPIWYWAAPNVVNTFVKQYDFSHKKVVLFATSGGSDMGKTAEKLQPYLGSEAEIVDAKVMNENPSLEALKAWAVY